MSLLLDFDVSSALKRRKVFKFWAEVCYKIVLFRSDCNVHNIIREYERFSGFFTEDESLFCNVP